MMNCFEDVKRELVNGNKFASNYDEFVTKVTEAIRETLNNTVVGHQITQLMLENAISNGRTPEQWNQDKVDLMIVLLFAAMNEFPELKREMAHHLYNELRKEN